MKLRKRFHYNSIKKNELEINLTKEKYKLKEIREYVSKWKNMPFSWIGRVNIVKVVILPKLTYTTQL